MSYVICEQQRRRSDCASGQSDQRLCCSLLKQYDISRFYSRNFKTLASFCGCAGRFVSGLVGNSWRHVLSCHGSINRSTMRDDSLKELLLFGPRQANLVLIAYASSEGSGEPAHPRSLARTFSARSYKQKVKRNFQTESQIPCPSEWLGMRS